MKAFIHRLIIIFSGSMIFIACSKTSSPGGGNSPNPPNPPVTPPVVTPGDPATDATIGFFLNEWTPVNFTTPAYTSVAAPTAAATATVTVDASTIVTRISPALFGNNSNPFMTQMVTEPALLGHLQKLPTRIIRAPGGSLSDVYFWNAPKDQPPTDVPAAMYNTNGDPTPSGWWYGKNPDSWTLSLDNYYSMLQQTSNQGIIVVNYAYARYGLSADPVAKAAHLAADWVRYDNGRTKYWEVGNENGGAWEAGYKINTATNLDGQPEIITGAVYGKHFNVFADSMRKAAQDIGKTIYIGAQILDSEPASWATTTDKTWNQGVLTQAGNKPDFYIVHNYFTPFNTNSNATDILGTGTTVPIASAGYLRSQFTLYGITTKPVALTEWNIFAAGSMQNVSHIAGMHLVMTMGELIKSKFGQASRWDLANGWDNGNDHGMFSRGEAGSGETAWSPRPAFYHQYFFQKMLGDRCINATVAGVNKLTAYASTFTSGQVNTTLINTSTTNQIILLEFKNFNPGERFYWYTLSGGTDNGEFSRKVLVNGIGPTGIAGGPSNYATLNANAALVAGGMKISVPAMSVVCVVVDKK